MGLKTERESLRNERKALRAAVQASFKDAAAIEKERLDAMRTASTQVGALLQLLAGGTVTLVFPSNWPHYTALDGRPKNPERLIRLRSFLLAF